MNNDNGSQVVWITGTNMVGYMPESTVWTHESFDSARLAMVDELMRDAERYYWDSDIEGGSESAILHALALECEEAASALETYEPPSDSVPEWSEVIGNEAYWINAEVSRQSADELNNNGGAW